jgi:hypothetical protein
MAASLEEASHIQREDERVDTYPPGARPLSLTSPYSSALRALYRERDLLKTQVDRVSAAIAALELIDPRVRHDVAEYLTPDLRANPGELQTLTVRAAAESVLDHVHRPLKAAELRGLMERGGKVVPYRRLYDTLKKRRRVFCRDAQKRWGLCTWLPF